MIRRIALQVQTVDGQRKITDFSAQVDIELRVADGASIVYLLNGADERRGVVR